jgi:hypothetical protein
LAGPYSPIAIEGLFSGLKENCNWGLAQKQKDWQGEGKELQQVGLKESELAFIIQLD